MQYISGLDLGQTKDYSALVVVEQTQKPSLEILNLIESHYAVRHIHRWPLQTPYTTIVADAREWFTNAPLRNSTLIVDRTGVGRGVYDMIEAAGVRASVYPYSITCGNKPGDGTVPKKDLVAAVHATIQTKRLGFAKGMEHADTLFKELENFREKTTESRNEAYSAWRDSDNDDLVLALALAVWYGESHSGFNITQPVITVPVPRWAANRR